MKKKIAVIGGGAAGMMAAIIAAREGAQVTIYERNSRLGKKILVTGNGKCNLGNQELSKENYYSRNLDLIEDCFCQFGTQETIKFFQGLGLMIQDKNGYLYPISEQASMVLDVLRIEIAALKIEVRINTKVTFLRKKKNGILLVGWESQQEEYHKVIIACGGKASPNTGSDGSGFQLAKQLSLELVPDVPALVSLKCEEKYCKAIAGVRVKGTIHIIEGNKEIACESGELQLTEYGISGIPVFQLSRIVNYCLKEGKKIIAELDFFPEFSKGEYEDYIQQRLQLLQERTVEEFFIGMLNKKLMQLIIKLCGCKTNIKVKQEKEERIRKVFYMCRKFPLHIIGSNSYDSAQVCAGGVALTEVTKNLESIKVPGVYFAGEVLDIDGRCGGYNLQWAWTSGYLAGKAASGHEVF